MAVKRIKKTLRRFIFPVNSELNGFMFFPRSSRNGYIDANCYVHMAVSLYRSMLAAVWDRLSHICMPWVGSARVIYCVNVDRNVNKTALRWQALTYALCYIARLKRDMWPFYSTQPAMKNDMCRKRTFRARCWNSALLDHVTWTFMCSATTGESCFFNSNQIDGRRRVVTTCVLLLHCGNSTKLATVYCTLC